MDEWAGSLRKLMTRTRGRTSSHNLFPLEEMDPEVVVCGVDDRERVFVRGVLDFWVCGRKTER